MNIRNKLIAAGVKNLQEYGYPGVTADNIMSDQIYSAFFLSMLNDNLGQGFDQEINALIASIKDHTNDA